MTVVTVMTMLMMVMVMVMMMMMMVMMMMMMVMMMMMMMTMMMTMMMMMRRCGQAVSCNRSPIRLIISGIYNFILSWIGIRVDLGVPGVFASM